MISSAFGTTGKALMAIAVSTALVGAVQGGKAQKTLDGKAQSQAAVTEAVQKWRTTYQALGESVAKWRTSYHREAEVQDMLSLLSIIDMPAYGLSSSADAMTLYKVDGVVQNNVPIGLTRICISSGGNAGALDVLAPSYGALFAGIKKLAARQDIYIGTISVRGDKAIPMASLGEFCVLLSKD